MEGSKPGARRELWRPVSFKVDATAAGGSSNVE